MTYDQRAQRWAEKRADEWGKSLILEQDKIDYKELVNWAKEKHAHNASWIHDEDVKRFDNYVDAMRAKWDEDTDGNFSDFYTTEHNAWLADCAAKAFPEEYAELAAAAGTNIDDIEARIADHRPDYVDQARKTYRIMFDPYDGDDGEPYTGEDGA